MSKLLSATALGLGLLLLPIACGAGGHSLRFFGTGTGDIDRVKVALATTLGIDLPVDVGQDFTIEFWLKAPPGQNLGAVGPGNNDGWMNGNTVIDRDVFGDGDFGEFGISLGGGRVSFGVAVDATRLTILGTAVVDNGIWHHIAVTRVGATGALAIFVDGALDTSSASGPAGNAAYRTGRTTSFPNSDPFLVIGAEKHDLGTGFPSFIGWLDEMRISNVVRYAAGFPRPGAPFSTDSHTVALYHFDEAGGDVAFDTSGAAGGPSPGQIRYGGAQQAPGWSTDTPFASFIQEVGIRPFLSGFSQPVDMVS